MTATGAPEAPMTPRERIKKADQEAREHNKRAEALGGEYRSYDRLFCEALERQFSEAIRESETSALRRAAEVARDYEYGEPFPAWTIEQRIRALIPSSPSTESNT